jgi:hypothetical protein
MLGFSLAYNPKTFDFPLCSCQTCNIHCKSNITTALPLPVPGKLWILVPAIFSNLPKKDKQLAERLKRGRLALRSWWPRLHCAPKFKGAGNSLPPKVMVPNRHEQITYLISQPLPNNQIRWSLNLEQNEPRDGETKSDGHLEPSRNHSCVVLKGLFVFIRIFSYRKVST